MTQTYNPTRRVMSFALPNVCFRQWRAASHCNQLHTYTLEVEASFIVEAPRGPYSLMELLKVRKAVGLEDKLVLAENDPHLVKLTQVSVFPNWMALPVVGCEAFAQFIFRTLEGLYPKDGLEWVRVREHPTNFAEYHRDGTYVSGKVFPASLGWTTSFVTQHGDYSPRVKGGPIEIELAFGSKTLDANNWVVDFGSFGQLKSQFQSWFDHTFLCADNWDRLLDVIPNELVDRVAVPLPGGMYGAAYMIEKFTNDWLASRSLGDGVYLRSVKAQIQSDASMELTKAVIEFTPTSS